MGASDLPNRLRGYIEACDERRGRPSDPARVLRIAAAAQPLLELGERLGPWPDTVPAGLVEDEHQ